MQRFIFNDSLNESFNHFNNFSCCSCGGSIMWIFTIISKFNCKNQCNLQMHSCLSHTNLSKTFSTTPKQFFTFINFIIEINSPHEIKLFSQIFGQIGYHWHPILSRSSYFHSIIFYCSISINSLDTTLKLQLIYSMVRARMDMTSNYFFSDCSHSSSTNKTFWFTLNFTFIQ